MEKSSRFLGACLIVALLMLGATWFFENRGNGSGAANTGEVKSSEAKPAYTLDDASLGAEITTLLQQNSGLDTSVSVVDLQTGKSYHWGDDASYTAASIGKLVTATAYLHMVELDQANLDDQVGATTARTALTKLIEESDNTAWHNLNAVITQDGLQRYGGGIGLTSYQAGDNVMTSADAALLLQKLAGQKLLDQEHTGFLLSLMKEASMRAYIVAAIPAGTDVYHKVGYLSDRLHDAAIIKRGDRSYVLVIFSKSYGAYDFSQGSAFFGGITQATLRAFFP